MSLFAAGRRVNKTHWDDLCVAVSIICMISLNAGTKLILSLAAGAGLHVTFLRSPHQISNFQKKKNSHCFMKESAIIRTAVSLTERHRPLSPHILSHSLSSAIIQWVVCGICEGLTRLWQTKWPVNTEKRDAELNRWNFLQTYAAI